MAKELSDEEIEERVDELDRWTYDGRVIKRQYNFKDFVEAMEFVNQVADLAEDHGHHPDIEISYNTVRLSLSTHSVGGITKKDFDLAEDIKELL